MIHKLLEYKSIIGIILLGIFLRLLFAVIYTHEYDLFNILVLAKSVADSNSLMEGFFVLKNTINLSAQLYGKIYYQIIAVWLYFLDAIHIVELDFLFDTGAYQAGKPYMVGFLQWNPFHYQLVAIKQIQFLFDFILLFFSLKIGQLLFNNKIALRNIALFWALNPFIIFTAYAILQSDLAMTSSLVAGIYFALKYLKEKKEKKVSWNILGMLFFFALGGVIKQVPILFVLPFLIVLSPSILSFIISLGIFFVFYSLLSQQWSMDGQIVKKFFLTSDESMALFNFNLNGVPIFMFFYLCFLIFLLYFKKKIQQNQQFIILLATVILSLIYISEDMRALFVQFNIWIMPLLAILTIIDPVFSLFFIAPIVGYYKRALVDNAVLVSSFGNFFGNPLQTTVKLQPIIEHYMNLDIIVMGLNTIIIFSYILLIITIFQIWNQSKNIYVFQAFKLLKKINIVWIPVTILAVFLIISVGDFVIRSKYVLFSNYSYDELNPVTIHKSPISIPIHNSSERDITALDISLYRHQASHNDFTIFTFIDPTTKQTVLTQTVSDFLIPTDPTEFTLFLDKTINKKNLVLQISKERGLNVININKPGKISKNNLQGTTSYTGIDHYYDQYVITLDKDTFALNIRGQYTLNDMIQSAKLRLQTKPTFYMGYGSVMLGILGVSLFLLYSNNYKNSKKLT